MHNRAVSEVLGFVLVFSLVTASVGTVYVLGFSGLENARDQERINNAERAFDVLADNMEDIRADDAPNRATEVKLYDAGLTLGKATTFTVDVDSGPTEQIDVFPIVYEPQESDTTIRYVNGAVIRDQTDGAVLLNKPSFSFYQDGSGDKIAVIPIVETRSPNNPSVGGSTTVLVRASRADSRVVLEDTSGNPVDFTVDTTQDRAEVWVEYIEPKLEEAYSISDPCTTPSGGSFTCSFTPDRVYMSVVRIDIDIES